MGSFGPKEREPKPSHPMARHDSSHWPGSLINPKKGLPETLESQTSKNIKYALTLCMYQH